MILKQKRLIGILITIAVLLLLPLIAMQFTNEVNWTLSDFVIAGVLLLSTGLLIEFVLRKVTKTKNRILLTLGILFILFVLWAEMAVGIFGSPIAGS